MLSIPLPTNEPPAQTPLPNPSQQLESSTTTTVAPTQQSEPPKQSNMQSMPNEPAAPKRALTDEDISALSQAIAPQRQQATVQTPLTPDQIKQQLHIYEPTAEWYAKFAEGGEQGIKAANELVAGLTRQFNRRIELELAAMREELAPGLSAAQTVSAKQAEDKFYDGNKDLNSHRDIVDMIYGAMKNKGLLNGLAPSAIQKNVADETRAWLKSKGIVSAAPNGAVPNGTRKVPASMSDGRGGGINPGGKSASPDTAAFAALKRIG